MRGGGDSPQASSIYIRRPLLARVPSVLDDSAKILPITLRVPLILPAAQPPVANPSFLSVVLFMVLTFNNSDAPLWPKILTFNNSKCPS